MPTVPKIEVDYATGTTLDPEKVHVVFSPGELEVIASMAEQESAAAKPMAEGGTPLLKAWLGGLPATLGEIETKAKRANEHHKRQVELQASGGTTLRRYLRTDTPPVFRSRPTLRHGHDDEVTDRFGTYMSIMGFDADNDLTLRINGGADMYLSPEQAEQLYNILGHMLGK